MTRTLFLLIFASTSTVAFSDSASTSVSSSVSTLALPDVEETILVTATRTKRPQYDVVPSTIVISREDIANAQASDLADLLRFQAGLDIGRNGGPGQVTSVFMRGTESNHTLILIDGVEMNPGTIGGGALQNISPEIIERIEIVKGPRSALYGSEAIGGVINIITRQTNKTSIETTAGFGSFGTRKVGFNAALKEQNYYTNFSLNWNDTEGFPTLASASENRGYENVSLNFKTGATLWNTDFELAHWQSEGQTEYVDFFSAPLDQDYKNQTTSLTLKRDINPNWSSQLILANAKDDIQQNQINFLLQNDFVSTERLTADWFNTYSFSKRTMLMGGFYYAREKANALSFGMPFSDPTEIKAFFIGTEFELGAVDLLTNMRLTDHDTAGRQTSWNIEALYPLNDTFKAGITAGSAFRAPDATDRFGFGGNPNLDTEESNSVAFMLSADTKLGQFRLEAFQNDIDNLINYVVTDFVTFDGQNENIDEAEIRGVELKHSHQWRNLDFTTTALVQSPIDRASNTDLLRRARRSITNQLRYSFSGGHNIGLQSLLTSERADFGINLPGYALFNLTGKYQVNERLAVYAKIENLADKEYQTAAGFNQAERSYYLNLHLRY